MSGHYWKAATQKPGQVQAPFLAPCPPGRVLKDQLARLRDSQVPTQRQIRQ